MPISGIDENSMKKIYGLAEQIRPELKDLLGEIARGLMDKKFDFEEIEEITGLGLYDVATEEYYIAKYKECLMNELRR